MLNDHVKKVTDDIIKRSEKTRAAYLARIDAAADEGPSRTRLSCGNLAHGFAACQPGEKDDRRVCCRTSRSKVASFS